MITSDEILKYIKISAQEADKLASDINMLAGQYKIENKQIIELLAKNPEELVKLQKEVQIERNQIKSVINDKILPWK